MFDPVTWTHDESIAAVQVFRNPELARAVGAGFAASLSTRRVEWRSALATWAMAEHLPPHTWTPVATGHGYRSGEVVSTHYSCEVCMDTAEQQLVSSVSEHVDLNCLNFERLKWGGVRLRDLSYVRFDLEQFVRDEHPPTQATDWDILQAVLDLIASMDKSATAGRLVRELKSILPGTVAEHRQFVDVLATAGVLRPLRRDRPEHLRSDWGAAGQWHAEDRYDSGRVSQFFPALQRSRR